MPVLDGLSQQCDRPVGNQRDSRCGGVPNKIERLSSLWQSHSTEQARESLYAQTVEMTEAMRKCGRFEVKTLLDQAARDRPALIPGHDQAFFRPRGGCA